jgi:HAE1 family hydrophobic/amphiphilic exporter-1
VVGGLVFSQLITLYITPVYYTYLDSFQKWMQRLFGQKKPLTLKGEPATGNGTQEVGSRQF